MTHHHQQAKLLRASYRTAAPAAIALSGCHELLEADATATLWRCVFQTDMFLMLPSTERLQRSAVATQNTDAVAASLLPTSRLLLYLTCSNDTNIC